MSDIINHKEEQYEKEDMFTDLDGEQTATEIESLCMSCGKNGTTRILLTKIPHFREVIIMAFECPYCHLRNNEIQSAGEIQPCGSINKLTVTNKEDLNRQLVKSDSASILIPEIELEIPPSKGALTTIEGLLSDTFSTLSLAQDERKTSMPEVHEKIEFILARLENFKNLSESPFTIQVDDPAGNSYIESTDISGEDENLKTSVYLRSKEQIVALGLPIPEDEPENETSDSNEAINEKEEHEAEDLDQIPEVLHFPAKCSACEVPSETRMHIMDIPYFKQIVLMSTACESCGYKSNEVKSTGAISDLGKRITLNIKDRDDLSRDILKSETCGISIPEIELTLSPGTLGGRFTTVEGLLAQVLDELKNKIPFISGDSASAKTKTKFQEFLESLSLIIKGERLGTLILDDPLSNSYLQNLYAPDDDPEMKIEEYERTFDQNEDLGLNDMKVENYHPHD